MTTTTEAAVPIPTPPAPDADTEDVAPEVQPEPEATDAADSKPGRDAAKYRVRLREAEAERDGLKASRDQLARQLLETLLPRHLKAETFWRATGLDAAALIGETGLDLDAARAAITEASRDLGFNAPPRASDQKRSPLRYEGSGSEWASAFGPSAP